MQKHVVIAGGGAAGFFAAINVASSCSNVRVTILEKSNKVLSKVRVSGGGRCNVTHNMVDAKQLSEKYPRGKKELIGAFYRFNPAQTIEWFARRGVKLKTEEDGRMFPVTDNSQTIIDCFLNECKKNKIVIKLGMAVDNVVKSKDGFTITCKGGEELKCDYFIIASGGYPNQSSYDWIKRLGHKIISPVPSLFTLNIPNSALRGLEGLAIAHAQIKLQGTKFMEEGPMIITHWGLSGPAVIRLSAWAAEYFFEKKYTVAVTVCLLPKHSQQSLHTVFDEMKKKLPQRKIYSKCFDEIPQRLWERMCELAQIKEETVMANISKKQVSLLVENLLALKLDVLGKTTFKEEFVTCGGVDLLQVDMKTMESKQVDNLFFAGEVLNVDGITGGFNFQAAWTGAWLAAAAIAARQGNC